MSFSPYPNEIYTTFSFLGLLMCIIPLPWHLKAWNVGTCLFMFWAGMGCLVFFVNSIVWHGNALNPAPIWCDICIRIIIGTFTGVTAASLCMNRRLYLLQLDPARNFAITKSDKIRSVAIDLCISLGLPIAMTSLHIVYQGHRFDIRENIGCYPHNHNTWVAILLFNIPPVLIGLISATYSICAIISINKRRNQFNELLANRLNITSSLYFRLMCFAGVEALSTTPIGVSYIIFNLKKVKLHPWISWKESHLEVNLVAQYPAAVWHTFPDASGYEFTRWICVFAAFVFFSTFGFAEEAKAHYRLAIDFFLKLIGFRVVRQTEILDFQTGPTGRSSMVQSNPTERLSFINKSPRRVDSLSTMSTSPECGCSDPEKWCTALCDTQDYVDGHLGSHAGRGSTPGISLNWTTTARTSTAVEQEDYERTPRDTQKLHSFLSDSSSQQNPFAHSSQMNISTVEPPNANHHSNSQLPRPLYSFLNLN